MKINTILYTEYTMIQERAYTMGNEILVKRAYAKINLGLDVIRRLENGYHEVRMVMQTVDLYDVLTFQKVASGIHLSIDKEELPAGEDNLIYKAASLLLKEAGIAEGVSISLEKHIPIAAGMAGGSADAAATLTGINTLFQIGLDKTGLQRLGVKLGADIPYCIQGGTALAEGIGEILTPLPAPPEAYLVIAKPDIDVSTKFVYQNLHIDRVTAHPDIDGMIAALEKKQLSGITGRLGNVLETVTIPAYPVIQRIKDTLSAQGAAGTLMSGSGPTVFGIFTEKENAGAAARAVRSADLAKQVFVTGFYNEQAENGARRS